MFPVLALGTVHLKISKLLFCHPIVVVLHFCFIIFANINVYDVIFLLLLLG